MLPVGSETARSKLAMPSAMRKRFLLITLWGLVACFAFIVSASLIQGLPLQLMQPGEWYWLKLLLLAFLLSSLAPGLLALLGGKLRAGIMWITTLAVFAGVWYLANWLGQDIRPTGVAMLAVLAALLNLCLPAAAHGRWRKLLPAISLTALFGFACLWPVPQNTIANRLYHGFHQPKSAELNTTAYPVRYRWFRASIPAPDVSGGGLATVQDKVVLVTGDGLFYRLDFSPDGNRLDARPLDYQVPINSDAFRTQGHEHSKFRVHGIFLHEPKNSGRVDVYVSHHYFNEEADCTTMRLSTFNVLTDEFLSGEANPRWRTLYETQPCLPTRIQGKKSFAGHMAGGRIQRRNATKILISSGDHAYDGFNQSHIAAQDMDYDYGKILEVDKVSGARRIVSSGLRNPQGLHVDPGGRIWATDHGPRGGDELNLVTDGSNFGWPFETYGASYTQFTWPVQADKQLRPASTSPKWSWLPSIGISNLISIDHGVFERWRGDLIVGSLSARTIYRVRLENGQPVYSEPVYVGERIRDMILDAGGRIVFWADFGRIGLLNPLPDSEGTL